MKSISKVLKIKANTAEEDIELAINAELANGFTLIAVESFGNSIRIYLTKVM